MESGKYECLYCRHYRYKVFRNTTCTIGCTEMCLEFQVWLGLERRVLRTDYGNIKFFYTKIIIGIKYILEKNIFLSKSILITTQVLQFYHKNLILNMYIRATHFVWGVWKVFVVHPLKYALACFLMIIKILRA